MHLPTTPKVPHKRSQNLIGAEAGSCAAHTVGLAAAVGVGRTGRASFAGDASAALEEVDEVHLLADQLRLLLLEAGRAASLLKVPLAGEHPLAARLRASGQLHLRVLAVHLPHRVSGGEEDGLRGGRDQRGQRMVWGRAGMCW